MADALTQAGVDASSRLCCAFSGGLDSVTLLHLLHRLQPRFNYHLEAAHVHHGLSPHADQWQVFCETHCKQLGIPLTVTRITLPSRSPEGLEAAARHARHQALKAQRCDWLVFAHHQDDQAETLLFRLLRGTGTRGAGGMAPEVPAHSGYPGYLRPLLNHRRDTLMAFARDQELEWIEDESNTDLRYTRNDLRHRIIPALEQGFPAAVSALARAAAHFRDNSLLLDDLAELDNKASLSEQDATVPFLSRSAVLNLSDSRLANLLRWHIHRLQQQAPSQRHLNEVLRQLRTTPSHQPLYLPIGNLACCTYRDQLWFEPHPPSPCPDIESWDGAPAVKWGDGMIIFSKTQGAGLHWPPLFDTEPTPQLSIRTRWSGIRMQIHPSRPHHSFKNLCQEKSIPKWLRERLPVLCVNGEPAWIGGIGFSAHFQCPPAQPGLRLEWHPFTSGTFFNSGHHGFNI